MRLNLETKEPVPATREDLIQYFAAGEKPLGTERIGIEFERFAFDRKTKLPISYKGGEKSVENIFQALSARHGWKKIMEGENVVALQRRNQAVTLEPGGQIELSGAPQADIHGCCKEVREHCDETQIIADELGVGFFSMGTHPTSSREDFPQIPKARYNIMRPTMQQAGKHGLDMMTRTTTVQVNLDYHSESDMVKKLRVSLALQPVIGALFSNSPFLDGAPCGFQSFRNHIWLNTDPKRTGNLPFAFQDGMGYERYVDYLLDAPMYFVIRDGKYIDANGQIFRDFMDGKLRALPGELALLDDFITHSTTVFPDVRLKQWLEMRGADGGAWDFLCALPAIWTGLLYDATSLGAAYDIVKDWTAEERYALKQNTPKTGLKTPFRNMMVQDMARQILRIAEDGLQRREREDASSRDERIYLEPLQRVLQTGQTQADYWLSQYHGPWGQKLDPLFEQHSVKHLCADAM